MSPLLDGKSTHVLTLAVVAAVGLSASACEHATAPGGIEGAVSPTEVLARAGSLLGSQIEVRGRIHVEKYETLEPCNPATGTGCTSPAYTSLHVVTPGEPRRDNNSLDLYGSVAGGVEPLRCRVIGENRFDCSPYTQDAVITVSGRLIKHRIPTQQVGTSSGRIEVIQSREIVVLLVQQ